MVKTLVACIKDLAHAKVTHHKWGNTWSKWPWRRWRQATRISPITSVPFKIFHFLFVSTAFLPVHSFFLLHHSEQLCMHQYNIRTMQKAVTANCIAALILPHTGVLSFPHDYILANSFKSTRYWIIQLHNIHKYDAYRLCTALQLLIAKFVWPQLIYTYLNLSRNDHAKNHR